MTGVAARRLRLAHVQEARPVAVALDEPDDAPGRDALVLVRPTQPWPVVGHRAGGHRTLAVQLCLPGVAGRYVRRLTEAAASSGWELDQLAALVVELERRCSYAVTASGGVPLGSRSRRPIRWKADVLVWHAGCWSRAPRAADAFGRQAQQARARGDVVVAAASGARLPRCTRGVVTALDREGVGVRVLRGGVAAELRRGWALEAFACPRITADHLDVLRDRFAAAPRCDWCGVPVLGRSCRRCLPGEPA